MLGLLFFTFLNYMVRTQIDTILVTSKLPAKCQVIILRDARAMMD